MNTGTVRKKLNHEQLEHAREVLEHYSLTEASRILSEPPPRGLGLYMTLPTLSRLKSQFERQDQIAEHEEIKSSAKTILEKQSLDEILPASLAILADKAFRLSFRPEPESREESARLLNQLSRVQKTLGLVPPRGRPLANDECRLAVAKLAREHYVDIKHICENLTFKEDQKLEKLQDLLFRSTKRI